MRISKCYGNHQGNLDDSIKIAEKINICLLKVRTTFSLHEIWVLYASCQCIRIISHNVNIRIYFNYNLDFTYPEKKLKLNIKKQYLHNVLIMNV